MSRRPLTFLALAAVTAGLTAGPALAQTTTDGGTDEGSAAGALAILLAFLLFAAFFFGIVALLVFVFRYAMRRSKERVAAMKAYAAERGLAYEGDRRLPAATPLLRRGGGGVGIVSGRLADGLFGKLAGYHYSTGSGDSRRTYFFTVALGELPEVGSGRFYCYRRVGGDLLDGIGDAITQYKTVELESHAFSESFRLMVRDEANMLAIRQLFSPSFIVFLTERVPLGFWFEVEDGYLLGAIKGEYWEEPAVLDEVCAATAEVAARIRKDVAERMELRGATSPPPPQGDEPPPPDDDPPPPPPPPDDEPPPPPPPS